MTREEIISIVGRTSIIAPVGSRVTCNPAPTDTDEDWLIYYGGRWFLPAPSIEQKLEEHGFVLEGAPKFYTGNDNGGFRSYRRGQVNLIVTKDKEFAERFLTATELAKRFNLMNKADRIALFQTVLYGVSVDNLEK